VTASALELFTDTSGVGCGGFFRGAWFSMAWPSDTITDNISVLELFAVCVAVLVWRHELRNKHIVIHSDNEAVVHVW